jgi:phenylacetate-CoA ligase
MTADALDHLRVLLGSILPANVFYARRLAGLGEITSVADFTARVPFTTKADLAVDQAANPPYGTNLTEPRPHYTRFCQTSGTTSRPLAILDTNASWHWMLGNWRRIYAAAGVVPGACIYFAFSFGPFLGFWTAFEAAAQLGCLCLPGGGLGSAARLRAMIEHGAQVLCCTPTYALRLAEVAAAEGIDLARAHVRTIIVAGEPGGSVPAVRERIRAAWHGAHVFDHYGMTEVGPVAYEDTARPGVLRIVPDAYFVEVIEPAGTAPVPDGGVGELVLTPYGRTAWPLLRYRTGDLVKWSRDAQGIALEGGIIGRADDMIVVRGVNIYPSAIEAVVRTLPEVTEYRVEVSRRGPMTELVIHAETADPARLEGALAAAFSLRIPVRQVAPGSLPRPEMKARRWHFLQD